MSLKDCKIKPEYISLKDNVPRDFFIPLLKESTLYKRAVGYFSSTALIELSKGICSLVKNGGKIQVIASPDLSDEDVDAIKEGYEFRKIIEQRLLENLSEHKDYESMERLNLLASLIADEKLDIKIACTKTFGIYHQKIGIIFDNEGNKVAFSGSANETHAAMVENYESFDVFKNWENEEQFQRVEAKCEVFDSIWSNNEDTLIVMDFPDVKTEFIKKYRNSHSVRLDLDEVADREKNKNIFFNFADGKAPHPHQDNAIAKFKENDFQCLFAMATGTGKTLTSLFAANELCKKRELEGILILVPLSDLVEQWGSDVEKYFDGTIIKVNSKNPWREAVSNFALQKILNPDDCKKIVLISTYISFLQNVNRLLKIFNLEKTLIIADECHKAGAESYRKILPEDIPYRIGLSATPKRPYDDNGTKSIFDYFDKNENPYEFGIEQAIENKMLCPYSYYPIFIELTLEEMEAYADISEKISKMSMFVNSDLASDDDKKSLEQLLKKRHRIIERAENKFCEFERVFLHEVKKYLGNTIVFAPDGTDENGNDLLLSYKNSIIKKLENEKIYITAVEYVQGTEKSLLDYFAKGKIDVVFAKQRLNEGIDIPSARRAFFIASSTSEREFIQRRGRVLRLCEGKGAAEIFDFIVIPPKNSENFFDSKIIRLIKESEFKRALDFAKTANNFNEIANNLNEHI